MTLRPESVELISLIAEMAGPRSGPMLRAVFALEGVGQLGANGAT